MAIVLISFTQVGLAQKAFEGRITYQVEYLSFPDGYEGMEKALPEEVEAIISGPSSRMQQHSALAGDLILIDHEGDSVYQVFKLLDKQVYLPKNRTSPKDRLFRIIETEETKTIRNRETRAMMLQSADGDHLVAWVDRKYLNPYRDELPGLCCLPLEYETIKNGIKMKLTASSIVEEPIDQTYFQLPYGVVRIDQRTLQKIVN